ncbi:MAG: DinB family protein [Tepidisphaeraceae bacterium]|jgi:hypothetical protein
MDKNTLLAALELSRTRLLDELQTIEKSGQDVAQVLTWRPGPGRANIGWQAMHCAATHERHLKERFLNQPYDEKLVVQFGHGSTPSDGNIPPIGAIRELLAGKYNALKQWIATQPPEGLARLMPAPGGKQRSVEDTILLMGWHEAHHQGQIHLTWNLYKVAHGIK